jgi:hypothetical protein
VDCHKNVNICSTLNVDSTSKDMKNHKNRQVTGNEHTQKSSSKANHVAAGYTCRMTWTKMERPRTP